MFIDVNHSLIAERAYESDIFKYPRYKSGVKDADKGVYKGVEGPNYPLLLIEDNLVNEDGYGIKRGFYKVIPDEMQDFLILYQGEDVKAKVPIVSVEQISKTPPKKMSKWKKKKIKRKGILPEDYITSKANIYYDKINDNYIIIWEYKNIKIKGIFKL